MRLWRVYFIKSWSEETTLLFQLLNSDSLLEIIESARYRAIACKNFKIPTQ